MLSAEDYRELSARCIELADESSEPSVAEAGRSLRIILRVPASCTVRQQSRAPARTATAMPGKKCHRPRLSLYPPPCAGESSRAADRFGTPSSTA
jgi:hypothetical protein